MVNELLRLLNEWGIFGVLVSLFIEGSALPFIGTFFILTVGFVMELTWFQIAWISLLGSLLYAIGSYIPFFIGYSLGKTLMNKLSPAKRESLEKAASAFNKFGIWSVAISSPLHLGNVIPFVAGMSRMNLYHYTILTMLGIAPSTFLLLSIGRFYPGDKNKVMDMIEKYQSLLLVGFVVITMVYILWKIIKKRQKKTGEKRRVSV